MEDIGISWNPRRDFEGPGAGPRPALRQRPFDLSGGAEFLLASAVSCRAGGKASTVRSLARVSKAANGRVNLLSTRQYRSDVFNLGIEDAPRLFPQSIATTNVRTSPAASNALNPIRRTRVGRWARQFLPTSALIQTLRPPFPRRNFTSLSARGPSTCSYEPRRCVHARPPSAL